MSSDSSSNVIDLWISVPCSFAILLVVSLAYKLIKSNNGRNAKIHALYWAIAVPTILLLPEDVATYMFTELTITLVGAVYPIYRAVKACCTPYDGDDKEWLQYWIVGGVLFMMTTWVDDIMQNDRVTELWLGCLLFLFNWLYFPLTCGALLIYEGFTEPFLGPKIKGMQNEITTFILYVQTVANALHIYLVWMFFMILPSSSKRFLAIAVGTIYPTMCSITASANDELDDIEYWLTYWSVYGCLFLIMDLVDTWMGQTLGFYGLVILITVYLMLPMFRGAEKVFRNILVPLAGLKEMLMLRDAYKIKRQMLKDLDPERQALVSKSVALIFNDNNQDTDPAALQGKLRQCWYEIKMHSKTPFFGSKKTSKYEQSSVKLNLV